MPDPPQKDAFRNLTVRLTLWVSCVAEGSHYESMEEPLVEFPLSSGRLLVDDSFSDPFDLRDCVLRCLGAGKRFIYILEKSG